jgi:selenocysteine lyase/cysteine desulfurase
MKKMQDKDQMEKIRADLERIIFAILETYSNVHRGSGYNSLVTTRFYEQARTIVLDHLSLTGDKYVVIFCSPRRADILVKGIDPEKYRIISSNDIGLPLGVRAIALKKSGLPGNIPFLSGGGTARLVSPGWIIWTEAPERFEAGTPPIINIIAFTRALNLLRESRQKYFTVENSNLITDQILRKDELAAYTGQRLLEELRNTLIGRYLTVNTIDGEKKYINLDNAASTRTFAPIWNTVCMTLRHGKGVYEQIIKDVKQVISEFTGAPLSEYDVIFTSNTTEAISLAAESLSLEPDEGTVVLNTLLEHNSNELPWRSSPELSLIRIKADKNGFTDSAELEKLLADYNHRNIHGAKRIRLVTISGASNVLGTFNDLEAISIIVHKYGARLMIDAAQMIAHRKVDMKKCAIDYLAFSGHKVYAPFGTGVLIVRKGLLSFGPVELEQIRLSGEENAAGIAALGKSIILLQRIGMDIICNEEKNLTAYALRSLSAIKGLTLYGIKDPDSRSFENKGGVISFAMKGKMANKVAEALAERSGIGVRSGCHCAHILVKYLVGIPPFLEQFQWLILILFPKLSLPGIVRLSLGIENNSNEIDILVSQLQKIRGKHIFF